MTGHGRPPPKPAALRARATEALKANTEQSERVQRRLADVREDEDAPSELEELCVRRVNLVRAERRGWQKLRWELGRDPVHVQRAQAVMAEADAAVTELQEVNARVRALEDG